MRKLITIISLLMVAYSVFGLERQPNADYRARRVALSQKTGGGAVLLFGAAEEGEQLYGFRQENNFLLSDGMDRTRGCLAHCSESLH